MFPVTQSTSFRVGLRLRSALDGSVLTGIPYTSVSATVRKADGTFSNLSVGSSDWSEATSGAFLGSGGYDLNVASSATDQAGRLEVAIAATGAAEVSLLEVWVRANTEADIYTSVGASLGSHVTSVKAKTDNLPSDPASQATTASEITAATSPLATATALTSVATSVTSTHSDVSTTVGLAQDVLQALTGRWKIDTTANTLTLYAADGTTVAYAYDLKDASGTPNSSSFFERVPVGGVD